MIDISFFFGTVDGGYTSWEDWTDCSVSCGGGIRTRNRTCTDPEPGPNGQNCLDQGLGNPEEQEDCNTLNCPGIIFSQHLSLSVSVLIQFNFRFVKIFKLKKNSI